MIRVCLGMALALGASAFGANALDAAAASPAELSSFEVLTVGTGAPELLLWFGEHELVAGELELRRKLAEELEEQLSPGMGRLHMVVAMGSPGVADPLPSFDQDFPVMGGAQATRLDQRRSQRLRRADSRALAAYMLEHRELTGILRVGAQPTAGVPPFAAHSFAAFRYNGLGLQERYLANAPVEEPGGDGAVQALSQGILEVLGTAGIRIGCKADGVTHLGGDLWQVDIQLDAPSLGRVRPDKRRTYPQVRFQVSLGTPEVQEAGEQLGANLVELAWRSADGATFKRLALGKGQFTFPADGIPKGATLRLIARVPAAVDRLRVDLDSGRAGRAECEVDLGRPEPEAPTGE